MENEKLLEKLEKMPDEVHRIKKVVTKNKKEFYVIEIVKTIWVAKNYLDAIDKNQNNFKKGTDFLK